MTAEQRLRILEQRIAELERRQAGGAQLNRLWGATETRPYQVGFPAILTSTFDFGQLVNQQGSGGEEGSGQGPPTFIPGTGYSWAQLIVDTTGLLPPNQGNPGIITQLSPLTGKNAYTPDNNTSLQPGQRGWLEADPGAAGKVFIPTGPGFEGSGSGLEECNQLRGDGNDAWIPTVTSYPNGDGSFTLEQSFIQTGIYTDANGCLRLNPYNTTGYPIGCVMPCPVGSGENTIFVGSGGLGSGGPQLNCQTAISCGALEFCFLAICTVTSGEPTWWPSVLGPFGVSFPGWKNPGCLTVTPQTRFVGNNGCNSLVVTGGVANLNPVGTPPGGNQPWIYPVSGNGSITCCPNSGTYCITIAVLYAFAEAAGGGYAQISVSGCLSSINPIAGTLTGDGVTVVLGNANYNSGVCVGCVVPPPPGTTVDVVLNAASTPSLCNGLEINGSYSPAWNGTAYVFSQSLGTYPYVSTIVINSTFTNAEVIILCALGVPMVTNVALTGTTSPLDVTGNEAMSGACCNGNNLNVQVTS